MKLPKARNQNIVINELEKELLIYDLSINKAFCLNETTAIVFNACGSGRTFDHLKREYNFTNEFVYLALDELRKNDLLEDAYDSPFAGMSRREAVKKVGLASMIALPVVSSLVAPIAAGAQSAAACSNGGNPQGQGTCPGGQRCVGGSCSACIIAGASLPGGCTLSTVARCCNSGCNVPSGNCT